MLRTIYQKHERLAIGMETLARAVVEVGQTKDSCRQCAKNTVRMNTEVLNCNINQITAH